MTLLSICQQVAREVGETVPSNIVGNSDETAKRLLACAQAEGNMLSRGIVFDASQNRIIVRHDWVQLRKEQTFATVNGTASYALTAAGIITDGDFLRFVNDTWWNRTNNNPLTLYNAVDWQYAKSAIGSNLSIDAAIIQRGNSILIDPTPSTADTMAFEYISTKWCQSAIAAGQTAWLADDDTCLLDEFLIERGVKWRFELASGDSFAVSSAEYLAAVQSAIGSDGGRSLLRARMRPFQPWPNTPQSIPIP